MNFCILLLVIFIAARINGASFPYSNKNGMAWNNSNEQFNDFFDNIPRKSRTKMIIISELPDSKFFEETVMKKKRSARKRIRGDKLWGNLNEPLQPIARGAFPSTSGKRSISSHCEECGIIFKNLYRYESHARQKHPAKKIFPCALPGCREKFRSLSGLCNHERLKHGRDKKFVQNKDKSEMRCRKCGLTFRNFKSMDDHFKRVHPGKAMYACGICDVTFRERKNCRRHRRSAHGAAQYPCKICRVTCTRLDSAAAHAVRCRRRRANAKEELDCYRCERCRKTFGRGDYLRFRAHIYNHKKSAMCPICKKGFSRSLGIRRFCDHVRIHHPSDYVEMNVLKVWEDQKNENFAG